MIAALQGIASPAVYIKPRTAGYQKLIGMLKLVILAF